MRTLTVTRIVLGLTAVIVGVCVALPTDQVPQIAAGVALVWVGVAVVCLGPTS